MQTILKDDIDQMEQTVIPKDQARFRSIIAAVFSSMDPQGSANLNDLRDQLTNKQRDALLKRLNELQYEGY